MYILFKAVKPVVVILALNLNTQEAKAERSSVSLRPVWSVYIEFQARWGYIVSPCLKHNNNKYIYFKAECLWCNESIPKVRWGMMPGESHRASLECALQQQKPEILAQRGKKVKNSDSQKVSSLTSTSC